MPDHTSLGDIADSMGNNPEDSNANLNHGSLTLHAFFQRKPSPISPKKIKITAENGKSALRQLQAKRTKREAIAEGNLELGPRPSRFKLKFMLSMPLDILFEVRGPLFWLVFSPTLTLFRFFVTSYLWIFFSFRERRKNWEHCCYIGRLPMSGRRRWSRFLGFQLALTTCLYPFGRILSSTIIVMYVTAALNESCSLLVVGLSGSQCTKVQLPLARTILCQVRQT